MSTQTFSKVFLFLNNKRKLKTYFSYYYWAGLWKQLAHDQFRPAQPIEGEGQRPGSGLRPTATWPSSAEAKGHADVETSRRRGSASGPTAIVGRVRASGRAHEVRKEVANAST